MLSMGKGVKNQRLSCAAHFNGLLGLFRFIRSE
jgi:hypothetical protein